MVVETKSGRTTVLVFEATPWGRNRKCSSDHQNSIKKRKICCSCALTHSMHVCNQKALRGAKGVIQNIVLIDVVLWLSPKTAITNDVVPILSLLRLSSASFFFFFISFVDFHFMAEKLSNGNLHSLCLKVLTFFYISFSQ